MLIILIIEDYAELFHAKREGSDGKGIPRKENYTFKGTETGNSNRPAHYHSKLF